MSIKEKNHSDHSHVLFLPIPNHQIFPKYFLLSKSKFNLIFPIPNIPNILNTSQNFHDLKLNLSSHPNLLKYRLLKLKKAQTVNRSCLLSPLPPFSHPPCLSWLTFSNSNQIRRAAKTAKVGAQSRHAFPIERFQSVLPVGFFPHPRFPYRALAKNLGYKVYPGCAHSKHRIRAHGRRQRAEGLSRIPRCCSQPEKRNRAFVSASSTGWNKKMGGALDVTGPDLGPGDQAARLGLRSVGPFPLPILILSLSLSFFPSSFSCAWTEEGWEV